MSYNRREFLGRLAVAGVAASPILGSTAMAMDGESQPLSPKRIDILVHFADSDYTESLTRHLDSYRGLGAELLMRSYAYIDYKGEFPRVFRKIHTSEQREALLADSKIVVSACPQTIAEAAAAGAAPIYIACNESPVAEINLIRALGVRVVENHDQKALRQAIREVRSAS